MKRPAKKVLFVSLSCEQSRSPGSDAHLESAPLAPSCIWTMHSTRLLWPVGNDEEYSLLEMCGRVEVLRWVLESHAAVERSLWADFGMADVTTPVG